MSFLPLQDVRVLEIAEGYAGPWAGTVLGDLGAQVIKIEAVQRMDLTRSQVRPASKDANYPGLRPGADPWNRSLVFVIGNRNKLSATINLVDAAGREVFFDLVRVSDVVLTNMVTGVPRKLGIHYEALRRIKPDLIYLSSCGFGATGPYATHVAMASSMDGASGHMWLRPYPGQDPSTINRGAHNDPVNALTCVYGAIAGLHHRAATGQGVAVDVSGSEAIMPHLGEMFLDYVMNGRMWEPKGNQAPGIAPHGVYRCAGDDNWIAIAVQTDEHWRALCQVLSLNGTGDDSRFATTLGRWEHHEDLDRLVESRTKDQEHCALMRRLQAAGVPAGAVLDSKEIVEDPHAMERRFFKDTELSGGDHLPLLGVPWTVPDGEFSVRVPSAKLGQHNGFTYAELLGYDAGAIARLREAQVLGEQPMERLV
jgi:crotonobetainyl-CoA:carnitine CoA-transferase CaiB-like acyl-CoA transferase